MATTELEKTLNRMKVTLKAIELAGTPARGFTANTRSWRVTLTRPTKDTEKPLRLTITILSAAEPTINDVIQCLTEDIEAGELSLWDFAQKYNEGETKEVEVQYKTCQRTSARARRFFGDGKVMRTILDTSKAA
jgi:hypothetical protein